jgi:hypothetical protein
MRSTSALNEPHNIDLTTEKENRKLRSRKIKRAVLSEWKRNRTKLLRNSGQACRTFTRGTEIPERKIRPACGATCRLK